MYYSTIVDVKPPRPLQPVARSPRADAARNRAAILAAATELFAAHGAAAVSMDAIAERAGVGKPTLYRHFGDRAGLAHAVFEERERAFQEALIRGPAPLGPGAPPAERIPAFLDGYLRLVEAHLDVLLAAETARPGARFEIGAYASYHRLLGLLLREAGVADDELVYLADLLLATTAADLYRHLRTTQGLSAEEICAAARALARRLVAAYAASASEDPRQTRSSPRP